MIRVALVLIVGLGLARVAHAQAEDAIAYRVKSADTLELIAAEFYGDRAQTSWIVAENRLAHGKRPQPGDRIKIPVTRDIVTAKGDSFESLAQTYLGDASRAGFLAEANSLSIEESLAIGTPMSIPLHVTYIAQGPETLAQIAQTFFGDPKQAELLRQYNNLDAGRTALEKSEAIIVPGLHVHVHGSRASGLDADAKARRDQQHQVEGAAAVALPRAQAAWLRGDFAGMRTALGKLGDELDYLDAHTALDVGMLLGRADVAFGDNDAAAAVFAQVLNRKPRHVLGRYGESPKVIAAWQKAGGHVDGE